VCVKAIGMNPIRVAGRALEKGEQAQMRAGEFLELLIDAGSSMTYCFELVAAVQTQRAHLFSPTVGSMPPPQPRYSPNVGSSRSYHEQEPLPPGPRLLQVAVDDESNVVGSLDITEGTACGMRYAVCRVMYDV
jgi:hypothetical protein